MAAWLLLLAALGADGAAPPAAQRAAPASLVLSIVGTNDLHGGILPRDGRGGLAILGGFLANLRAARARDGGGVLLVDAGDMFQGTLESNLAEGAPVVAAYNALGYAAAAIGNHEFDFGPVGAASSPRDDSDDARGALKARAADARFPFLAANLIDEATGSPVTWPNVRPSARVEVAGVAVGIVGVITAEALEATSALNTRGLRVAPLAPAVAGEAQRLRRDGATVIVVVAHAGGRCTRFEPPTDLSSCERRSEIIDVARALPPRLVDVIVAGHTHAGMAHEVAGIAIVQSFSGGRAFGRVDLTVQRRTGAVTGHHIFQPRDLCDREDPRSHRCDAAVASTRIVPTEYEGRRVRRDERIAAVLAPAVEAARQLKAEPLGVTLDTPLRRDDRGESALGNLFTDALRESVAGADLSINNNDGGLRADLPRGPLTYGSLYEAYPFDNLLVQIEMTGAELRRVIRGQLTRTRSPLGISGVTVDARCTGTMLQVDLRRATGTPIRDEDRLLIATTEFLVTGGDGILSPIIPPGGLPVRSDARTARDAVADWLRRRGGRLSEDQLVGDRRWIYPGALPLRCGAAAASSPVAAGAHTHVLR